MVWAAQGSLYEKRLQAIYLFADIGLRNFRGADQHTFQEKSTSLPRTQHTKAHSPELSQVKSIAGQDVSTWDFWDILEA